MPSVQLTNFNAGGLSTTGKYYADDNSFADGANLNLHNPTHLGTLQANQKLRQLPFGFISPITSLTNFQDKLIATTEAGLIREISIGTNDYEIRDIGTIQGYTGFTFNSITLSRVNDVSFWDTRIAVLDNDTSTVHIGRVSFDKYDNSEIVMPASGVYGVESAGDDDIGDSGLSINATYIITTSGYKIKVAEIADLGEEDAWEIGDITPTEAGQIPIAVGVNDDDTVCVLYSDSHVVFGEVDSSDKTVSFATNRIKVVNDALRIDLDDSDNLQVLDDKGNLHTYPITGSGTSSAISTKSDTTYTDLVRTGVSEYDGKLIFSYENSILLDGLTSNKIINSFVYDDYFYYITRNGIGRFKPDEDLNEDRQDVWALFRGGSDIHAVYETENQIYIGDKNYIVRLRPLSEDETEVLSLNALRLDARFTITALSETFTDLLIGTYDNLYNPTCSLLRWNRDTTQSYTLSAQIAENKITGFIHNEAGHILVLAGDDNNIYTWNGYSSDFVSKSGVGNNPNPVIVPFIQHGNLPLYASKDGVYSYGHNNNAFQRVVNLEYRIENANITAMQTYNNTLFIANHDKMLVIDDANKADAYMTTMILSNTANIRVLSIDIMLANTESRDVSVKQIRADGTDNVLKLTPQDKEEMLRFTGVEETSYYQFTVFMNANGDISPNVLSVLINY